ncbi:hypothetical protein [Desulfopila aestuarii]|uniref:Uncharacterized protein n=1 Tax=Desulfopila aestuarii DSM 18488 TaxID=1121416 RepID=A0A1M7YDS2_9BACT|nr:hypothetical protein [Desulfopila aestuarii]SHO50782.1 hypothetical protein SAMN02745220_03647 [Desulfopila aestuarii DSM 18488]
MNNASIIDVNDFLERITERYTLIGHKAASLASEIHLLQPDIIEHRCQKLNEERLELSTLDDELIEILKLAGKDIVHNDHLNHYRKAFSSAVQSVNSVHSQLLIIKQSLQDVTRH